MNAEGVRQNSPGSSAQRDTLGTDATQDTARDPSRVARGMCLLIVTQALPWAIVFHAVGVKKLTI